MSMLSDELLRDSCMDRKDSWTRTETSQIFRTHFSKRRIYLNATAVISQALNNYRTSLHLSVNFFLLRANITACARCAMDYPTWNQPTNQSTSTACSRHDDWIVFKSWSKSEETALFVHRTGARHSCNRELKVINMQK